ncbi:MAG TPA: hypothetical protein VLY65_00585 [Nitrososphaerales archaeon]|nr:hypothetical protein [Nitrososphaerales archaeon]
MDYGSRTFQVVAAVVVIALLGGAFAYYTTMGTSTTTSTTKSTQSTVITFPGSGGSSSASTGSKSGTSTQSVQTVVSSTTLPCTAAASTGISGATTTSSPTTLPNYIPLFSTISAMTMFVQQVIVDQYGRVNSSTIVASYQVAGRVPMEGTEAYVVKLNVVANESSYAIVNGTNNQGGATAYFDPEGDLLLYSQTNLNQTGTQAILLAQPYLDWFDTELISTQQYATYSNPGVDTILNQTAQTLGSVNMTVTFAEPKAIPYSVTQCGATTIVERVQFAFGVVPGTQTPLITYYYSLGTDGAANEDLGYKILSMTPA